MADFCETLACFSEQPEFWSSTSTDFVMSLETCICPKYTRMQNTYVFFSLPELATFDGKSKFYFSLAH